MTVILGQIKKPVLSTFSDRQTDDQNAIVASNVYMKYVNENVFAPAGLPTIHCKPTDGTQQGLTYKFAAPDGPGGDCGDLLPSARSWLVLVRLATGQVLPNSQHHEQDYRARALVTDALRTFWIRLGSGDIISPDGAITGWWKTGGHPAANNDGEINTMLVHFSNGVEIAMVINGLHPVQL